MNKLLTLLGLALMANGALASGQLSVKWSASLRIGKDVFIEMPYNKTIAIESGWEQYDRPDGSLRTSLDLYCNPDDLFVCVLYDSAEHAGGVQIAVQQDLYSDAVYDWVEQGYLNWTAKINDGDEIFWAICIFFMSDDYLAMSTEERQSNYSSDTMLPEGKTWITGFNNELVEVVATTDGVVDAGFTKQSCIPWMGHHYYWNMTTDSVCSSTTILPFFLLLNSGVVSGYGWNCPGVYTKCDTCTIENETPSKTAVEWIVPNGPTCMAEQAESPGMCTLHIYITSEPYLILCLT